MMMYGIASSGCWELRKDARHTARRERGRRGGGWITTRNSPIDERFRGEAEDKRQKTEDLTWDSLVVPRLAK